jgi:hypothetical protein
MGLGRLRRPCRLACESQTLYHMGPLGSASGRRSDPLREPRPPPRYPDHHVPTRRLTHLLIEAALGFAPSACNRAFATLSPHRVPIQLTRVPSMVTSRRRSRGITAYTDPSGGVPILLNIGIVARYPNHVWSVDRTRVLRWGLWPTWVLVAIDHFSRRVVSCCPLEGPTPGGWSAR